MDDRLLPVYTAANEQDAHLLKDLLQRQGINAVITNEALQAAAGALPLGWSSAPRVLVMENDAPRALQIVADFETTSARTVPPVADAANSTWIEWPVCPQCGRRRQAVCTSCDVAGTDFPLADYVAPAAQVRRPWRAGEGGATAVAGQGRPVLLMCPNCNEAFAPRFYRHCEQCGHDFGSGVKPEAFGREPFNARAAVVIFGLILLAAGLLIYFAVVMSG